MCSGIILCCSGSKLSYSQLGKESPYFPSFLSFSIILPPGSSLNGPHGLLFTGRWFQYAEDMWKQQLLDKAIFLNLSYLPSFQAMGFLRPCHKLLYFSFRENVEPSYLYSWLYVTPVYRSYKSLSSICIASLPFCFSTLMNPHLHYEESETFPN